MKVLLIADFLKKWIGFLTDSSMSTKVSINCLILYIIRHLLSKLTLLMSNLHIHTFSLFLKYLFQLVCRHCQFSLLEHCASGTKLDKSYFQWQKTQRKRRRARWSSLRHRSFTSGQNLKETEKEQDETLWDIGGTPGQNRQSCNLFHPF